MLGMSQIKFLSPITLFRDVEFAVVVFTDVSFESVPVVAWLVADRAEFECAGDERVDVSMLLSHWVSASIDFFWNSGNLII